MRSLTSLLVFVLVLLPTCRWRDPERPREPRRVVDLSPIITEQSACLHLGRRACEFFGAPLRSPFVPVVPADPNHSFGLMTFPLLSHGGAHLDAPGRLLREGARAHQVPLERLIGPARVWDLRWHDRNSSLEITDLEQQSPVEPGEILLILVGYTPPESRDWPVYAWLSPQAANWLASRSIRALGTDMPSLGSFERSAELLKQDALPEEVWAQQLPFFQARIPLIAGLINLDQITHEPAVTFVGFPLAVADRSGAPMRAAALVY